MSFQFEDDSALEELLNQQLDRRKQQPSSNNPAIAIRPSTTKSGQRGLNVATTLSSRPSTATNAQTNLDKSSSQAPVANSLSVSKSKLASWLDGSNSRQAEPDVSGVKEVVSEAPARQISLLSIGTQQLLEDQLTEEYLQEMSKQRLVKLITEDINPLLRSLRKASSEQSEKAVEQLKDELQLERNRFKSLEMRHIEQMKLTETRWTQLNKQLESRVELSEQELSLASERHKTLMVELEEEHKQQIDKLKQNYQTKMAEEKSQLEEKLRRREELHNLELESKLKVNCDLVKLETVFDEWHKMIQTTIKELDLQFKGVESLLDKQTIEINGTNSDLAKKSKELADHYEKFELQNEQLGSLARELNEILPNFSRIQQENESLAKQTSLQLEEFLRRNDQLRAKERELEQLKDELSAEKTKLSEQRFELALSSNRVAYKEERLAEIVQSNEGHELMLAEQRREQIEKDARLGALQTSLDIKSNELKQQNYDLHLTRKKLTEEAEKLTKLELELEAERKSVQEHLARVQAEAQKLGVLREKVRKELNQLKRLQKSLVCSLCLDRLFKGPDPNYPAHQLTRHNRWIPDEEILDENNANLTFKVPPRKSAARYQLDKTNFEQELTKLNQYIETDAKQLEMENKYVDLLMV